MNWESFSIHTITSLIDLAINKGVGMGQVLLEILWTLPWQDLPIKIKHADMKALATWAKTLWGVVTVIIMYHGILKYLTQCFWATVLFKL